MTIAVACEGRFPPVGATVFDISSVSTVSKFSVNVAPPPTGVTPGLGGEELRVPTN